MRYVVLLNINVRYYFCFIIRNELKAAFKNIENIRNLIRCIYKSLSCIYVHKILIRNMCICINNRIR